MTSPLLDGALAGAIAGVVAGAPSTLHAVATGARPLDAVEAAGSILTGERGGQTLRVVAAIPVHAGLSAGWGAVLGVVLPRRRTILWGAAAGLAIGALDLLVVGRRLERIARLPLGPQLADHVVYGAVTGALIAASRRSAGR